MMFVVVSSWCDDDDDSSKRTHHHHDHHHHPRQHQQKQRQRQPLLPPASSSSSSSSSSSHSKRRKQWSIIPTTLPFQLVLILLWVTTLSYNAVTAFGPRPLSASTNQNSPSVLKPTIRSIRSSSSSSSLSKHSHLSRQTPSQRAQQQQQDAIVSLSASKEDQTSSISDKKSSSNSLGRANGDVGGDDQQSLLDASSVSSSSSSSKKTLLATMVGFSTLVAVAAKTGLLSSSSNPLLLLENDTTIYTNSMIVQDLSATWFCAASAYILVKFNGWAFGKGIYGPNIARKVVHILSGPLFIVLFPLFTMADGARYFAAIVSITNLIQLYLSGSNMGDPTLAKAVSRSGDTSEALGGPLLYVLIVQTCLLLFWRSSPIGVVAISTMAAGDGMADLIGRKWGRNNKWFFSDEKSIVGTIAFATFSALTSFTLLQWLVSMNCMILPSSLDVGDVALRVCFISIISAIVELLPIGDDNITVPLTAGTLAAILLQ